MTARTRVTVPGLDHQVASVFWEFMTASGTVYDNGSYYDASLSPDPYYATGYPDHRAVLDHRAGKWHAERTVLVQVFERRVLTYTPDNDQRVACRGGQRRSALLRVALWRGADEPGPVMYRLHG